MLDGVATVWSYPPVTAISPVKAGHRPVTAKQMKILDVPQSGSMGGVTSSRNRFGQYRRTRATPVNPSSSAQGLVRARMTANASGWRAITAAQRAGWADLGAMMRRTDSLGQTNPLNGFQAYVSVNNNRLAAGDAVVSDAPALTTPANVTTATVTLSAAAFSIAFTATPLPAATKLQVYVSAQKSAGRSFESDVRLLFTTMAAQASPAVITAAYTAKFGVPVVGNRVFIVLRTYFGGFLSGPFAVSQVVS